MRIMSLSYTRRRGASAAYVEEWVMMEEHVDTMMEEYGNRRMEEYGNRRMEEYGNRRIKRMERTVTTGAHSGQGVGS